MRILIILCIQLFLCTSIYADDFVYRYNGSFGNKKCVKNVFSVRKILISLAGFKSRKQGMSRTSPHPAIRRRCVCGCRVCRRNRPVHLSNVLPRLGTAHRLWSNACRPGWCRTVPVGCPSSPIAESTTRPLPALPV